MSLKCVPRRRGRALYGVAMCACARPCRLQARWSRARVRVAFCSRARVLLHACCAKYALLCNVPVWMWSSLFFIAVGRRPFPRSRFRPFLLAHAIPPLACLPLMSVRRLLGYFLGWWVCQGCLKLRPLPLLSWLFSGGQNWGPFLQVIRGTLGVESAVSLRCSSTALRRHSAHYLFFGSWRWAGFASPRVCAPLRLPRAPVSAPLPSF